MKTFDKLTDLREMTGHSLGTSDWVTIDQKQIGLFAEATGDHQWIHVDEQRAANGPFGKTIAHGFLTLSLIPEFLRTTFGIRDVKMGINYGLNRVRFMSPVVSGSRLRAHSKLLSYEDLPGNGAQMVIEMTVEVEGSTKPACVAESISRRYT
ncbi:MAG: MaoC family dehydratase [Polaromonas sp.]|uniref:MaoC family dehydratase n=1 Tax=Polaromonas sp. TaxID=1869339 RepID=UPI0025EB5F03|nr:MaoC family dehydratase [Polaromonas sp.]MBI2727737.1 MaoC family dehydratase [Polaromonas sp.]